MKLRRTSLALATATIVALSGLPSIAGAQEATDQSIVNTADSDIEQWPGSSEGSSMLLGGTIPPAPEFGSSRGGTDTGNPDDTEDQEGGGTLVDDDGNIPVIGSISLPGWISIPIAILQVGLTVTTFMAQAAYILLSMNPNGSQILREWLISVGINPDA